VWIRPGAGRSMTKCARAAARPGGFGERAEKESRHERHRAEETWRRTATRSSNRRPRGLRAPPGMVAILIGVGHGHEKRVKRLPAPQPSETVTCSVRCWWNAVSTVYAYAASRDGQALNGG